MMIRRIAGNSTQTLSKALDSHPQIKRATQKTMTTLNHIYSGFSVVFVISVICASILWSFERPVVIKDLAPSVVPRVVIPIERGTVRLMDLLEIDANQKASYSAELQDVMTGETVVVFPRYILPRGKELKSVPIYFPEWIPKGKYIFHAEMKIRVNPIKNSTVELEPVVIEIN